MSAMVYIAIQDGDRQLVIDGPLDLLTKFIQEMQAQLIQDDSQPKASFPSILNCFQEQDDAEQ